MSVPNVLPQAGRKRKGRPAGRQFDQTVNVRLPGPALEAIRVLAKINRSSTTEIIRSGLLASLSLALQPLVDIAKNGDRSGRRRLRAIAAIHQIMKAALHLGPAGLKLARLEAAAAAQQEPGEQSPS